MRPGVGSPAVASLLLAAGFGQVTSVVKEAANRIVGAPDMALSFAGSRRRKKLRLRVCILRDEEGNPVATRADVEPALAEARRVLALYGIEVLPAAEPLVRTLEEPAPKPALDSACADGSWQADFGPGGAFFRRHRARNTVGTVTGSGAPITAFVVRDVLGRAGCSLGPLVDYVTVDMGALKGKTLRVLAHELGHACGLPHSDDEENLMLPKRMGDRLESWQVALFRGSRHVTYH
jgi:Matrixin